VIPKALTKKVATYSLSIILSHYKPHFLSLSVNEEANDTLALFHPFFCVTVEPKESGVPAGD
jgi:hypothetical protein